MKQRALNFTSAPPTPREPLRQMQDAWVVRARNRFGEWELVTDAENVPFWTKDEYAAILKQSELAKQGTSAEVLLGYIEVGWCPG